MDGALVLLDDYGFYNHIEQKKAFDIFAKKKNVEILTLPTGQGLLIKPHSLQNKKAAYDITNKYKQIIDTTNEMVNHLEYNLELDKIEFAMVNDIIDALMLIQEFMNKNNVSETLMKKSEHINDKLVLIVNLFNEDKYEEGKIELEGFIKDFYYCYCKVKSELNI